MNSIGKWFKWKCQKPSHLLKAEIKNKGSHSFDLLRFARRTNYIQTNFSIRYNNNTCKKNIKKPQTDEMIRFMKKKVPLLLEYSIVFLLGDKIFDISSALFTFPWEKEYLLLTHTNRECFSHLQIVILNCNRQ